jgi:hypothetical protein
LRHYTLRDGQPQWKFGFTLTGASRQWLSKPKAEMVQGIDRLRLIHSAREKTVYILCNIPLDTRLTGW